MIGVTYFGALKTWYSHTFLDQMSISSCCIWSSFTANLHFHGYWFSTMLSSGQVTFVLTCKFCLGMHWPTLFGTLSVPSLRSDFDEEATSVLVTTCNAEFGWLSRSRGNVFCMEFYHVCMFRFFNRDASLLSITMFSCTGFGFPCRC